MTTMIENRQEWVVIWGFVIVVLAVVAVRGAAGAPILAGLAALGATTLLVMLVRWYRKPATMLVISPEEIFYGRVDEPGRVITRTPDLRLEFQQGYQGQGWSLVVVDEPDHPTIPLIGFNKLEVERACVQHGWTFVGS